jgi:hypothetical protein
MCPDFAQHGIISDYWCSQDEFEWVIHRIFQSVPPKLMLVDD